MAKIPSNYREIARSKRVPVAGARRLGPADPNEVLTVSVRVRRRLDGPPMPGMRELAAGSKGAGRVSREKFAAKFGSSEEDLAQVEAFGRSHGLRVVESSAALRTVVLEGTVAQMNAAFGVDLGRYESPSQSYRGREGHVHIPGELQGVVEGVFGLDNRQVATRGGGNTPKPPSVTPRQMAELYGFPLSLGAAGQTIAIIEFGGGYKTNSKGVATDIEGYFDKVGLTAPTLFPVPVDGASNSPGNENDDAEVALDIEVAASVAQGANIAVYFAPNSERGWTDVFPIALLQSDLPAGWAAPSVIAVSWCGAELGWTTMAIDSMDTSFQDAAALGVTVLASSGDNGSDCKVGDGKAHVNYPASDPWVIGCGGTSLETLDASEFTEVTWNDNGVTGGGISDLFPVPYWQAAWNLPGSVNDGHEGRGVPDIAGYANGYTIFLDGKMQSGWWGTSEAAPLYAGLVALMNAAVGDSVGYLNPILYDLGGTTVFRDIADGGSNAGAGAPGYTAGPGWDACTGWGSVDGSAFLNQVETCMFAMLLPALL
jgi:kumamolisin